MILKAQRNVPLSDILLKSLDLITIVIPPALPMAMTIGVIFAQARLKQSAIYCISPRSINISGCINCVCFDKTGTLTEDDLNFTEVRPVNINGQHHDEPINNLNKLNTSDHLLSALATCHSLTLIDGNIIGDPLDQKMFAATGWILEEPAVDDITKYDLLAPTVVRPPPSSSSLQSTTDDISSKLNISNQCISSTSETTLIVTSTCTSSSTPTNTPIATAAVSSNVTSSSVPLDSGEFDGDQIGILRQFTFSSSLQRMSVVTRRLKGSSFDVYVKGAPEVIVSLCNATSIPNDFECVLGDYTRKGFRVLALAYRSLNVSYVKMQRSTREEIEKNLTLLGFLVMGNMLKPETTNSIDILQNADIRCVMVTGDNMLTALSVARECHMILSHHRVIVIDAFEGDDTDSSPPAVSWHYVDSVINNSTAPAVSNKSNLTQSIAININCNDNNLLNSKESSSSCDNIQFLYDTSIIDNNIRVAITGKTFRILREYYPSLLNKVIIRGSVFARMAPDQKQQLIEMLQDTGYYVAMCGDGANDCGALKAAHAGVSLSETEASVASPFTSKNANISCIPVLIREGRASLVTAFGILKYMACYSICQFASVILLYTVSISFFYRSQFAYYFITLMPIRSPGYSYRSLQLWSNLTDFEFLYQDLFLISLFFVVCK